ncbi:hypothetical protein ScalyP_jg9569 [Parmales sp. scaly parma]|nr:hypothetical protein ScalyP_jg9569 [Parmales sp. scaly parma]|tara:strand:+ start:362 stop:709 length:348 start_codon:yes stop_codon:yes gene_type:complete
MPPGPIHPLVRNLYKRALTIGLDYPSGLPKIREKWKTALRKPSNFTPKYTSSSSNELTVESQKELAKAVARGRWMCREMIGVIQLKKYRAMKQRYEIEKIVVAQERIEKVGAKYT